MTTIINYPPKQRPGESDRNPFLGEKRPVYSLAAEHVPDDPTASLTDRADIASPDVVAKEPPRLRLPSVEEFDFEEAFGAKRMARKFAPRFRNRNPDRDRWNFPEAQNERNNERNAEWRDSPQRIAARPGSGGGFLGGFCAAILIVMGTSAAFGFVQPLNDLLPERMGGFLSEISGELGASLFDRADPSAIIEAADGNPKSDRSVLIPAQPMAAAMGRSVSNAPVASAVQPSATRAGFGIVEQAEPPAANEIETPPSKAALATAPDEGSKDYARVAALQRSVEARPPQIPNTAPSMGDKPAADEPATDEVVAEEPVSGAAQPVMSHQSSAQIDRLLARGEELLQSGDIASARLLFLRVAAAGDRRGAKGVGMTYDPRVLARLPVAGLTPDRQQAEFWYEKAGENSPVTTDRGTMADASKAQADARPGSPEWNAACAGKYESFEQSTGLYTAHSGAKRPCRLP